MELKHAAIAGTLESSDLQVTVEPGGTGVELSLESSVMNQFGQQIRGTVLEVLRQLEVENARVSVVDRGAVDCTIRARVQCAVFRAVDQTEGLPWGVKL